MIELSRLNGKKFVLNCDLIKTLEATPDTVITLTTGEKLMVLESIDAVVENTVAFRQRLAHGPIVNTTSPSAASLSTRSETHPTGRST